MAGIRNMFRLIYSYFEMVLVVIGIFVGLQFALFHIPCYFAGVVAYGIYKFFEPDYETAIVERYKRPIIGLRLCTRCTNLRRWPAKRRTRHYHDFRSLEQSALGQCWLCRAVWKELLESIKDRDDPPALEWPDHIAPHRLLMWFADGVETGTGFLNMLRGKSYAEYVYGPHARPLLHDLSSESSFDLIREWVQNCDKEHKCYQGHQSPLPTRVIDVSGEDPHLFISNGLKCPYITLSHCWGGEQPLITTKDTLDERTIRIPMQSLPPLYCDAVIVTRRLGIQYLWIDSLCIVQDCKDDWRKEAAKMGEIYRLSYVTLSALSAPNCRQRILIQRTPDPNKPTQSEAQGNVINLRDRPREHVFKEAPLSQRAWAVQERLLSPRILHYSTNELFWECLFCSAREGNFRVIPSKPKPYSYDKYECMQVKVPLLSPLDPNPLYPVSSPSDWNIIVAEYTRCRLTLSSDKLPALSGLASLFQRNTRFTYLAGLWAEDLGNGLLWFCPDKQTQTIENQVDAYRGPSWSWVSTDLAVQDITFRTPSEAWDYSTTEIRLLDFNIQHAGPDPLGEVLSAVITVQAFFYKLTYESKDGTRSCTVYDSGGDNFGKGILDALDEEPGFHRQCAGLCIQQCTGLGVARRRRRVSQRPAPTVTYFLVVVPVLNAGEECWKRVGLAWTPALLTHSAPEMSVIRLV